MGVPAPAARPAREREAHLEVEPAFDFDPPPGEPPGRIAKEHGVAVRAKNPRCSTLAYVPELQTFYCGREDGAIVQWRARMFHDAETVRVSQSRPAFTLHGHVGKVTALLPIAPVPGRFTHGTLVTGGADASIRVWDPRKVASSGAQLQRLRAHKGAVLALEQCVDKLVSGCSRGEVRLWAPYDAKRPSDDDIAGIADAARGAPIGVTYALFQPLRVLLNFETLGHTNRPWVTGLSFGKTASVGDFGNLFVATSAGSVFRVSGAKPRSVDESDESGSDGDELLSDWDDGASAASSFASSHKSSNSNASSKKKAAEISGGFSAFMNLRPPPGATFPPLARAEPFLDLAAEEDSLVYFEPSELEDLGLPFDPCGDNFHRSTRITHVSYYPSERLVLTLSFDGVARLTDSATGKRRAAFEDADGARFVDGFVSLNSEAGARVLYLVDDRGDVRLYDILDLVGVDPMTSPRCVRHVTGFVNSRDDDGDLKRGSRVPAAGIVSVPEAKAVATLSALGRVCGLRVTRDASFEIVRDFMQTTAHDRAVSRVAVGRFRGEGVSLNDDTSDDDLVFTASSDGSLKQRDPHDLMCVRSHDVRLYSDVTAVLVASNCGKLVTGHDDGSLRVWDVVSGDDAAALSAHENAVSCLCEISTVSLRPGRVARRSSRRDETASTDTLLLSGGFDGRLVTWRVRDGNEPPERKRAWRAHDGEILAVAPAEGKENGVSFLFASCGNDGMVKLWKGAGEALCAWRAHGEPVTCLASLGGGGKLVTGSEDGTARVWDADAAAAAAEGKKNSDPETPRPLLTLDAYAGPVVGVHAMREPRGGRRHLVTASAGAVCVWDVTEMPPAYDADADADANANADAPEISREPSAEAEARVDLPPPELLPDLRADSETTSVPTETAFSSLPEETLSVLERRRKRTSQTHREVSRFRRDDAFACFAIRERENQILIGTRGGNLIALDAFAAFGAETAGKDPDDDARL